MPRTASGNLWMSAGEHWLAENVWPHVGRQRSPGMNDLTGTWDLGVEMTIVPWSKIWMKLRQAEADAESRGLDLSCVWKKRNRLEDDHYGPHPVGPGEGAVVMVARQFFPMVARLEQLEAAELSAADGYDRGFSAGVRWARAHPELTAAEDRGW